MTFACILIDDKFQQYVNAKLSITVARYHDADGYNIRDNVIGILKNLGNSLILF